MATISAEEQVQSHSLCGLAAACHCHLLSPLGGELFAGLSAHNVRHCHRFRREERDELRG